MKSSIDKSFSGRRSTETWISLAWKTRVSVERVHDCIDLVPLGTRSLTTPKLIILHSAHGPALGLGKQDMNAKSENLAKKEAWGERPAPEEQKSIPKLLSSRS